MHCQRQNGESNIRLSGSYCFVCGSVAPFVRLSSLASVGDDLVGAGYRRKRRVQWPIQLLIFPARTPPACRHT